MEKEDSVAKVDYSIQAIEKMGTYIANSGLFGVKTPAQAIALMLIAQAEGLHPAMAARDYDIIQGRPALKAKAKLARFQRAGGVYKWIEYTDTKCSATFQHPSCPAPLTITWTLEDAKKAGLAGKDNWSKFPRQMLSARVISEGVDKCYPDAGGLMYVPEEVMDFTEVRDTTVQEQKRLPEPKHDDTAELFSEMCAHHKLDADDVNTYLRQYIVGSKMKVSQEDVMRRAMGNSSAFLKAFADWQASQTAAEDEIQLPPE